MAAKTLLILSVLTSEAAPDTGIGTGVFTPRVSEESHKRITMRLNVEDYQKVMRGKRWKAVVRDQNTGKLYEVRGAPCGLPRCYCDAVIVRELFDAE